MFEPPEIDDLQTCFDTILERRGVARSGDEAEAIARALILARKRGVADRDELIQLADIAIDRNLHKSTIAQHNQ